MQFKWLALVVTLAVLCLTVHGDESTKVTQNVIQVTTVPTIPVADTKANTEDEDAEETEEDTEEKNEMKPKDKMVDAGKDDDDEDEEGDEYDGEEEECDTRISSIVRSFNTTPFLPDDYQEAYESVTKTDLVNKRYNITDMMSIVQRFLDFGTKMSKNKDLADTGMYLSSIMMDRMYEARVSAECTADLANIGSNLQKGELWPAKCMYFCLQINSNKPFFCI